MGLQQELGMRIRFGDILCAYAVWDMDKEWVKDVLLKTVVGVELCSFGDSSFSLPYSIMGSRNWRQVLENADFYISVPKTLPDLIRQEYCPPIILDRHYTTRLEPKESPSRKKTALYLGRIAFYKGLGHVLDLAFVCQDEWDFLICGDPTDQIRDNICHLGKSADNPNSPSCKMAHLQYDLTKLPNVKFLGAVHGQQKSALLANADVLLQPSHYPEPFGINILEAHISGTPTITTNAGAFKETVIDDVNGYKVSCYPNVQELQSALSKITSRIKRKDVYDTYNERYHSSILAERYVKHLEKFRTDWLAQFK
jgi:glycosyltransferase involved in cell wall biosynthesis